MAINFTGIIVGAAVGGIDEALERNDAAAGRVGNFKTYRDYYRVGAVAAGLAMQTMFPRYAKMGEDLTIAAMPGLVKSLAGTLMPVSTAGRIGARRAFAPRGVSARAEQFDQVRMV